MIPLVALRGVLLFVLQQRLLRNDVIQVLLQTSSHPYRQTYRCQVAAATQVDIMDLRSVVPVPAADIVPAADDGEYDLVSVPKRVRHGYVIDDFVVDTSASDSDYSLSSCS